MPEIGDIFRSYGPQYLEAFSDKMLPSHRRAISDIANCRTGKFGYHIDTCTQCGHLHMFFHSCCNRSCPRCQRGNTEKWLEKRQRILLPVPYFHVVFTLPGELRSIVRSNQAPLYNCLFNAATYALFKLMADPVFAGGLPGMLAVLHTWCRDMNYHPHIHLLIPAVVVSGDGSRSHWLTIKKKKFLVPENPLSDIFRARFMKLARKELPHTKFPQSVWNKKWVVFLKPVKKGAQKVLEYLARYVYRIAITNRRIVSDNNGMITFEYQDSGDSGTRKRKWKRKWKWKKITVTAFEFMRRFLQHVLPRGFHKVRTYGFLAPLNKEIFYSLKLRLEATKKNLIRQSKGKSKSKGKYYRRCPKCKTGTMKVWVHIFFQKNTLRLVRPPPCKR